MSIRCVYFAISTIFFFSVNVSPNDIRNETGEVINGASHSDGDPSFTDHQSKEAEYENDQQRNLYFGPTRSTEAMSTRTTAASIPFEYQNNASSTPVKLQNNTEAATTEHMLQLKVEISEYSTKLSLGELRSDSDIPTTDAIATNTYNQMSSGDPSNKTLEVTQEIENTTHSIGTEYVSKPESTTRTVDEVSAVVYQEPTSTMKYYDVLDMEYENLLNDLVDSDFESKIDKRDEQAQSVRENYKVEYEQYKSPRIKSASLLAEPNNEEELLASTPTQNARIVNSGNESSYNYTETSYLLTSDVELDQTPFVTNDSKIAKQLELQDDDVKVSHAATVSGKSLEKSVYILPPITVELGEGTSLLLNANQRQELYFEVTNNLNNAAKVTFTVKDEMRILLGIDKFGAYLGPHESTLVRVAVIPRVGVTTDRITFIVSGSEQVRKEIIVEIGTNYQSDDDYPEIDYTYTSDCTDVLLTKCQHGTWTIKVSAKDSDSGLLHLTSVPKGLYFPDGYVSGTRDEVTGYYSDTCCRPELQITAVDRMNNRIVKQLNAYTAPLSFWAIIAIVLISLTILIAVVLCVVFCVKKFKKKEGDSFDLPTYRGGRSRY